MYKGYKLGVKLNNRIKWLNLYDYRTNANVSARELNRIGFKKEEIIIKVIEK